MSFHKVAVEIVKLWNEEIYFIEQNAHAKDGYSVAEKVRVEFHADTLEKSWWVNDDLFDNLPHKSLSNQDLASFAAHIANLVNSEVIHGVEKKSTTENLDKVYSTMNIVIYNHNSNNMNEYKNFGNAGAMGDNPSASNFTQNQTPYQIPEDYDFQVLSSELKKLKNHLQSIKDDDNNEQLDTISNIREAEKASVEKRGNDVVNFLKKAGTWALNAATDIGTTLAAEMIKKSMGLQA